jgi:asparagine synthase (glutamine-hydrolysing)
MCGIAGFCAKDGSVIDVDALGRAVRLLKHRGPDDEGYVLFEGMAGSRVVAGGSDTDPSLRLPSLDAVGAGPWSLGLGHRRLSIIDLSPAGHQPMGSSDGECWITFNGEIYNYLELRRELAELGAVFHGTSDTEVLLAAYRHWGDGMLPRLEGMFAFAIVDLQARSMLLARDPLGIKPLYLAQTATGLAFASEIKSILAFPGVTREVDPGELFRFLRFGIIDGGSATIFRQVRQLPGGHFLRLGLENPSAPHEAAYWRLPLDRRRDISPAEASRELRALFERSVQLHLRSDVPVGACLSGGLDSSAIVRVMRDLLGAQAAFHTFSYVADDPRVSELPYVEMVSEAVGSSSHLTVPRPQELARDFDAMILAQDQPIGGTSIYAQYRVFELAHASGIKVMLDGQGSDEFFGGYHTAISAQIGALLARGHLLDALKLSRAGEFLTDGARRRIVLSALGRLLPPRVGAAAMSLVGERIFPEWVDKEWFQQRGLAAMPRPQGRGRNALREELAAFTEELSLPQLLRYEDRNSMHFSIESRVPFCLPSIVEFAFSLPPEMLVSADGVTKAVLREAVRGLVPDAVLTRAKVGFGTPERSWLEELRPWVAGVLSEADKSKMPFLRLEALRAMAGSSGGNASSAASMWRALALVRWADLMEVDFA